MQNDTSKTGAALMQDVDRLKRDAARMVSDARDHAQAHVAATRVFVGQTVETVQEKLASNPLYVLGLGFVIGVWVGSHLFSRRSD